MKKFRQEILICMATVLFLSTSLFAITNIIYDQRPPDTTKSGIHAHDYDLGAGLERIILADDWQHANEAFNIVKDVHWFGYVENNVPHSLSTGFHLSIHNQDPQNPPCVPIDPAIWEKEVPLGSITVTDTGLTNFLGERLYQYDYYLDASEWVILTFGQKYWFDVSANSVDPVNNVFKWKWAEVSTIQNCPAAQKIDPITPWQSLNDTDFAFVITSDDAPQQDEFEYGDAPEDALAYPSLGTLGFFPTCKNVPIAGYIEHNNFGAYFGGPVTTAGFDFETDGNGGLCPSFAPYDNDECWMDGDAGLLFPDPATIVGGVVTLCPGATAASLGQTCTTAAWGVNVDIEVTNNMPNATVGYVNVLMDWNQDGVWAGLASCPAGAVPEHVLVDHPIPNPYVGPLSGLFPPGFTIGPNNGYVWTRFSITEQPVSTNDWDGSGVFEDGETEDYLLHVDSQPTEELDFGDAPDPTYPTLLTNNGARHIITAGGPYFDDGSGTDNPDPELDGQPTAIADGDDNDGNDDEDGVQVPTLIIGQNATIAFDVASGTGGGTVEAFIDWNADGDWLDAGEALPPASYPNGPTTMTVAVPASAVVGSTFARFRISAAGPFPMTDSGLAQDGEVEDYAVHIEEEQNPDEVLKFQQLPLNGPEYFGHDELSTAYRDPDLPIQFEGCYMADDFADLVDTPVIKIKWWGSYLENEIMEPIVRFLIAFETDIPAIGQPGDAGYVASHPGVVLQTEIVNLGPVGALLPGEYSEVLIGPGGPPCFEALYEYEAVLANPFPQEPNTVYWLKITALIDDIAVLNRVKPPLQASGLTLCQFLNLPNAQQAQFGLVQPVTRWGWHNRDYTIMDPYASVPPAVVPGENNQGPLSNGNDVWHFQDDAVSGEMFIDESDPIQPILNQYTWQEEYYKYFSPLCAAPPPGVDGPEDIQLYSKDLAFELWTPWTPTECVKSTASFYADWVNFGSPTCWCYQKNCRGDADGANQGSSKTGFTAVYTNDLTILSGAWNIKEPPAGPGIGGLQICADFDHAAQGSSKTGFTRVYTNDLTILSTYWNIKEPPAGPGVPVCPMADYNFWTN